MSDFCPKEALKGINETLYKEGSKQHDTFLAFYSTVVSMTRLVSNPACVTDVNTQYRDLAIKSGLLRDIACKLSINAVLDRAASTALNTLRAHFTKTLTWIANLQSSDIVGEFKMLIEHPEVTLEYTLKVNLLYDYVYEYDTLKAEMDVYMTKYKESVITPEKLFQETVITTDYQLRDHLVAKQIALCYEVERLVRDDSIAADVRRIDISSEFDAISALLNDMEAHPELELPPLVENINIDEDDPAFRIEAKTIDDVDAREATIKDLVQSMYDDVNVVDVKIITARTDELDSKSEAEDSEAESEAEDSESEAEDSEADVKDEPDSESEAAEIKSLEYLMSILSGSISDATRDAIKAALESAKNV